MTADHHDSSVKLHQFYLHINGRRSTTTYETHIAYACKQQKSQVDITTAAYRHCEILLKSVQGV